MPSDLTDEQARALGERWIKAGGGWLVDGGFARWDDGALASQRLDGAPPGDEGRPTREWWPDLRDPATKGAALEVVRGRLSDATAHLVPPSPRQPGDVWTLWGRGRDGRGQCFCFESTEEAALVAALEAVP
jgi:hypothetical protein